MAGGFHWPPGLFFVSLSSRELGPGSGRMFTGDFRTQLADGPGAQGIFDGSLL